MQEISSAKIGASWYNNNLIEMHFWLQSDMKNVTSSVSYTAHDYNSWQHMIQDAMLPHSSMYFNYMLEN